MHVIKRNGDVELFNSDKIYNAILKSMIDVSQIDERKSKELTKRVTDKIIETNGNETSSDLDKPMVTVDYIHDVVEDVLLNTKLNDVAKSYILYRDKTKPNIFRKRTNLKPYVYSELGEYVDAIRHSY